MASLITVDRQLAAHAPLDASETDAVAAARHLLARSSDPLGVNGQREHLTASALTVDGVNASRVLLHFHRRIRRWLQPGGHLEAGETPAQTAVRELAEETGCTGRHLRRDGLLVHVDRLAGPDGHQHLDLRYLLVADARQPMWPRHGESPTVRWWPLDHPPTSDDSLLAAITAVHIFLDRFR